MIAPKISIKGQEFRVVSGDEETVLDKSIDVVIVGANPKLSKSWYANEWSEDSQSSTPDCYSLDGVYPVRTVMPCRMTCVFLAHRTLGVLGLHQQGLRLRLVSIRNDWQLS